MGKKAKISRDQRGMVSILVTMIIMIIISLIVLGFARLVRREQRQTLDRQLSTQAFYAAETGISDAIEAGVPDKTDCGGSVTGNPSLPQLEGDDVKYTCLLIDRTPTVLKYDSIDIGRSTIVPVKAGININKIKLQWKDKDGGTGQTGCPTTGSFPDGSATASGWPSGCSPGMLRVDLVPINNSISRDSLMNRTLTLFLQPQSSGVELNYGASLTLSANSQGGTYDADCDSGTCNYTINVGSLNLDTYYLRVRSIYKTNTLNVTATDSGGNALELEGAQAVIDSTGKATDVLRRVVARVSISQLDRVPDFAIQSHDSICKRLAIVSGQSPDIQSSDPACQLD